MNTAATAIEIRPKSTSRSELKSARPAAAKQRVAAEDRQEGTVQQRPGKQRGNDRGGLAVGVGQPGVQRRQAHLGSVADQEEQKRRLEPERIQAAGVGHQVVDRQVDRRPAGGSRGHGDEEIAQQRQGDAHRTDQQILPRGFQRTVMAMEVDQRGAGQGGGFDATHIRPKCRLTATSVMVARNNSRQPAKTASGKLTNGKSSSSSWCCARPTFARPDSRRHRRRPPGTARW